MQADKHKEIESLITSPDKNIREQAFAVLLSDSSIEGISFLNRIIFGDNEVVKLYLVRYITRYYANQKGLRILKLLMENKNEHIRTEASDAFATINCSGKKDIILEMFQSKSDFVIGYAIREAGDKNITAAIDYLFIIYEKSNVKRKIEILIVLREIRGTESINGLIKALDELDESVLFEVIQTLGLFYNYVSWNKIVNFLEHPSVRIRKAAVWFLSRYKSKAARDKLLTSYFEETDPVLRNQIIDEGLLQYKEFKVVAQMLETLVCGEDYNTRLLAECALDQFPEKMRYKVVKKYRNNKNERLRAVALGKAGNLKSKKAKKWLVDALMHDNSYSVRVAAAQALGVRGDRSAMPQLEYAFLFDEIKIVSYIALMALTKIWDQNDWGKIYSILEFPEQTHCESQIIVLRFIQKKILREKWDIPANLYDRIMFRLHSRDINIRYVCMEILRVLKDKKAVLAIIDIYMSSETDYENQIALKAINDIVYDDPLFIFAFLVQTRPKQKVFIQILQLIEKINFDPEFDFEMILQMSTLFLRERSKVVKTQIVKTLLNIFKNNYRNLSGVMKDANDQWLDIILKCAKYAEKEDLKIFGPEIFLDNLENPIKATQEIAIRMLGLFKEERALQKLTVMAISHKSMEIRKIAREAVHQIFYEEKVA